LIPLGCDGTKFQRDNEYRIKLRQKYGITEEETVFCYAGKIIEDKGVDILIDAAIELLKSNKKIKVLCIGGKDDLYFSSLEGKIKKYGFTDKFLFVPAVPNNDLFKYYSMADVGIWPKQCSISMIEAMACELPVVISNKSGSIERINENINGFLYNQDSVEDLRDRMNSFLNGCELGEMGANAKKTANQFDWRIISKSFEALYRK
jgi:glycosyltransferase involved in cell wall biosynthesis